MRLFRAFDRRIAAELRSQARTIRKGLVCVGLTSLLTAATIPLTKEAIQAIEDAGAKVGSTLSPAAGERLGRQLGRQPEEVRDLVDRSVREAKAEERRAFAGSAPGALARFYSAEPIDRLGIVCLAVVLLFGLKYFLTRGQFTYLSKASAALASELRLRLFTKLLKLPVSTLNEKRAGALQSVLTNDINVYQTAVTLIRDSIDGPAKAVFALITIFAINWQLALLAMAFVPVMAWFVNRNGRRMKAAQARVQDDLADLTAMSQEALNGTRVIKAFAAENRVAGIFRSLVQKQLASQLNANRRFAQLRPMVELIGAVALACVLYVCGHMAKLGTLQIAQIVALTLALDVINQGMRSIANVNNTYNQVQAAADRIYGEILDIPDEPTGETGARLDATKGRLVFEDVSFEYPDGTKALEGVSFVVEPGTSLALVGPSGAGKSTIADLTLRFYDPSSGRITLDGTDVRELDVAWYRSQFGVVPQQTFLFAGTIADNLRLGTEDASDDDLKRSAELAHADGFVSATPDGFQTVLGERGVRLSGGEGQRLAIARALVRDPAILLLDEATSNLDAVSERAVTAALDELMHRKTTLFIAHRLTTASRADKILVLRRGKALESGTHEDLMAADGVYASMFRAFAGSDFDGDGLG
ncbi:MAG: ABC transporter ATP-binding protein [Armatimonadetes bacterium]|nr:ABC transporter ATP-binding protein [Armatimonadota bacterium]